MKNDTYTAPKNKDEIKQNLIKFNEVCNKIFKENKDVFYTDEELNKIKSNIKLQKKENIELI